MPRLESSAIAAAGYNPERRLLFITFRSGGTYTFYRVPPETYHGLISATSPGRYYHARIRGRHGPRR